MEVAQVAAEAGNQSNNHNCISAGDTVIIDCGDKSQFLVVRPPKTYACCGSWACWQQQPPCSLDPHCSLWCPPHACSKVKLGGSYCSVEPLIGAPYGSIFTLSADGKSLQRTTQ